MVPAISVGPEDAVYTASLELAFEGDAFEERVLNVSSKEREVRAKHLNTMGV